MEKKQVWISAGIILNTQQDEVFITRRAAKAHQGGFWEFAGGKVESGETADLVAEQADQFALICIDFPKFIDGRGYSAARLLRERYGYQGELRAVGDVLIDQLFFMKRVGFNSFALRADQDVEDAITAFQTFTNPYQGDVNDPRPLFRRQA